LTRISEWLNPILVKEARQSLKSKHFAVIFFLVLISAWAWSFLGLMAPGEVGPFGYVHSTGGAMLLGYSWIMLFPLLVVIPFMAFFSLAAERDDGTYELVAITTLQPRQIVAGRIASAMLQMIVFLSVLSPCVAFTYLLRGVDLVLILLLLSYSAGMCLLMTSAALLAAAIGQTRLLNLLLAIPLLVVLVGVYFGAGNTVADLLRFGMRQDYATPEFWIGNLVLVTLGASFFVLLATAATMLLTFVSQNRSTPLRLAMLVQQMLAVGWGTWYAVGEGVGVAAIVVLTLGAIYWGGMGSLMIAESTVLHQRARRRLPQSFLGRAFLTWICPGPGTGYVFAVANLWTLALALLAAIEIARHRPEFDWWSPTSEYRWIIVVVPCYVTIYLGLARLILLAVSRHVPLAPPLGLLTTALLVFVGALGPMAVEATIDTYNNSFNNYSYSLLQLPNPLTTLGEIERNGPGSVFLTPIVVSLLFGSALVVCVNLVFTGREVRRLREPAPQRVLADDAARRPPREKDGEKTVGLSDG
jgi:hypothetical protein